MILAVLLLSAAAPETVVEAEQALDAAIASEGQWTAQRARASKDAVIFVPQAVNAEAWFKDRPDPSNPVLRQLTDSYMSCDGTLAVTRATTTGPGRTKGYFTTVWRPTRQGWRWILAHGDKVQKQVKAGRMTPRVHYANCNDAPGQSFPISAPVEGGATGAGQSFDGTLAFNWRVEPNGARTLTVKSWNGKDFDVVLTDTVKAPK